MYNRHKEIMDLFSRVMVGDKFLSSALSETERNTSYPPYNIIKLDDTQYRIDIALAGFDIKDLKMTQIENKLNIKGEKSVKSEKDNYVWKGIANRDFTLSFILNSDMVVTESNMENGVLSIHIKEIIPESKLPKEIPIMSKQLLIENKKEVK